MFSSIRDKELRSAFNRAVWIPTIFAAVLGIVFFGGILRLSEWIESSQDQLVLLEEKVDFLAEPEATAEVVSVPTSQPTAAAVEEAEGEVGNLVRYIVVYSGGAATRFNGSVSFDAQVVGDPEGDFQGYEEARINMIETTVQVRKACTSSGDDVSWGYSKDTSFLSRYEGVEPLREECAELLVGFGLYVGEDIPKGTVSELNLIPSGGKVEEDFLVISSEGRVIGRVPSEHAAVSEGEECWKASLKANGYGEGRYVFLDTRFGDSEEGEAHSRALHDVGFSHVQRPILPDFCGYLGLHEVAVEDYSQVFKAHKLFLTQSGEGYSVRFNESPETGLVTLTPRGEEYVTVGFKYDGTKTPYEHDGVTDKSWRISQGALVTVSGDGQNQLLLGMENGELVVFQGVGGSWWKPGDPVLSLSLCSDGQCPSYYVREDAQGTYFNLTSEEVISYDPTVVEIK